MLLWYINGYVGILDFYYYPLKIKAIPFLIKIPNGHEDKILDQLLAELGILKEK